MTACARWPDAQAVYLYAGNATGFDNLEYRW